MRNTELLSEIRCPFCNSDKVAYEGMYSMAESDGIVMFPESAYVLRCGSCKKLFFFHGDYIHAAKQVKINFQKWKEILGIDLFSNLIILSVGLNRLYALMDLLLFSDNFDKTRSTARHDRNYTSALIITFGILHEMDRNLDSIMGSIINKHGNMAKVIRQLKAIYLSNSRLRKILTEYRDKLSNHYDPDIIKHELQAESQQEIGFIKYDSQIDRDIYYEFEEISNRGFIRLFFNEEIESGYVEGKTFEEMYKLIFSDIISYFAKVHFKILKEGHSLIKATMEEYNLPVIADIDDRE